MGPAPAPMPLVIANYNPEWPGLFEKEAEALRSAVPTLHAVEHIGSTAVPGMSARPTIDLLAGAADVHGVDARALEGMGYAEAHRVGDREPGRRFFWRGTDAFPLYHLHVVIEDGDLWRRHLAFRDRLRADPTFAERYAHHKRQLARQYADDPEVYAEAKSTFIEAALS